ncbi:flagellar basal body-associated FliL family protein [Defluviimonas sp. WL0024]|uniref:Flagellar protein FliL n=2 Tax=Albidovulum TaxID=205889 RepID=A0ABT3J2X3_9RHOB|nr:MULTISPECIES: flagellar basal body-associated FliL family protein [Defluviimonas]MCU9849467.1 flagellar basal body-associated FliL family protein [Defluviimonas sp. WL0024]MCW3782033.1 flagellar basal body-associated FliL family protein [Defluviimonas salinarum]
MRKVVPLLLALFGLAAGGGAGFWLRPAPMESVSIDPCGEGGAEPAALGEAHAEPEDAAADPEHPPEYVKLANQFVVPVVEHGDVAALVILSISLEVTAGSTEQVFAREPKIRDAFLRVLFDHANVGGFEGAFTESNKMEVLRGALLEVARKSMGPAITGVLIVDIVRQDS